MSESLVDLQKYLLEIEEKVNDLLLKKRQLQTENQRLAEAYTDLEKKYEEERKRYQILAEREKETKLHAAISGNPEHNRLMKHHINRLIKEIDYCIAELQNTGL